MGRRRQNGIRVHPFPSALIESEQNPLSSVLPEAITESSWANSSSLPDAATTTDLWNDFSAAASAKPQYPVGFGQPADLPPARPRRRGLWRSALAALVLTAALARLYLGSRLVEDDEQLVEEELTQLQNLSAHAKTLSGILKDERAAKQIQDFRLRVAALHAELAERHEEADERGVARGPWATRRDALLKKRRLEEAQKDMAEITQSLQKLTWKRLHGKAHGVFGLSEHLAQHVEALTKVAEGLKTEEACVTKELVTAVSRAVKQDVQALKTMLREGDKLLASPLTTFGEGARLLGVTAAFAEKVENISVQAHDALARVEGWRGAINTVVAMGALIEGVEIARQIDRLRLDAVTLSGKDQGGDVLKGFARAQHLVEALLAEVQRESCPVKIADHLSRLKELGREAQARFEDAQKLAGHDKGGLPVCRGRNLAYYEKVAKQEANAAELYGDLVNTLITKATAFARRGEAGTTWHTELTASLGKIVLLSRRVGDTVEDAREGAEDTAAATSIADAAVKANVTKELLGEVYKDALEAVRATATCTAWAQLDSAAQGAVASVERNLALLQEASKGATKAQSLSQLLQDGDPKLAVRRYRASTTLRQGKRQVLWLLRTAKRLENKQMSQELRWLRASKEKSV
ncbi:hypothetical protein Emag_001994 [Eimeria magna]